MRWMAGLVAVTAACGGDDVNGPDGSGPRLKATLGLDLSTISGFAISDGAVARTTSVVATDGVQRLYALDAQGNLIETTVIEADETGDGGMTSSMMVSPSAIFDTPKHVFIEFRGLTVRVGDTMESCAAVIVRKADGALYCYSGGWFRGLASDGADLVYAHGPATFDSGAVGALTRIDMAQTPPTITEVADRAIQTFDVNTDGDALLALSELGVNSVRVHKRNGGLQNLIADRSNGQWTARDGHDFYYLANDQSLATTFTVNRAARQGDGAYIVSSSGTVPRIDGDDVNVVLVGESAVYAWVKRGANQGHDITELLGATQGMERSIPQLTGFATITDVRAVATSIFVQGTDSAGNGGISRITVPAFMATTILPPGAFTLTAISASKTGDLSFAGLRNSDGAKVVGYVPAGSDTFTITSASAPTVTQLQRIN